MWFHLTLNPLYSSNNRYVIHPKIPVHSSVEIEGNIPRICVSDHIALCLRSMVPHHHDEDPSVDNLMLNFSSYRKDFKHVIQYKKVIFPYVYCTEAQPYLPPDCVDFRSTHEHWFIEPTMFTFIGNLNLFSVINGEEKLFHDDHAKSYITVPKEKVLEILDIEKLIEEEKNIEYLFE